MKFKLFKKLLLHKIKGEKNAYNALLNQYEEQNHKIKISSAPLVVAIGVTNICNLKCPLCITGLRKQEKKPQHMEWDLFVQIIEKIKDYKPHVQLYKWGESLLHPRITDMFEYCSRYNLKTELSSNLSLENIDDKLEAMVKYGLNHLIVSFDGVTQEDYSRYRRNGNLETVISNMQKIQEYKKKYNNEFPKISLQFLKNKYTKNQIEVLEKNYQQWGADDYYTYDMTVIFKDRNKEYFKEWFEEDEIKRRKYLDIDSEWFGKMCLFLYQIMVIEQDGSIPSCCFATSPKDDYSKWDNKKSITEMFNSEKFMQARKMFKEKTNCNTSTCNDCSMFITYCQGGK